MRAMALGVVLLLATVGLAQQQQPPSNPPPNATPPTFPQGGQLPPQQMPPDQDAPPPQAMSSADVQQQIQQALSSEPALSGSKISVMADDSSVVLAGTVDTQMQHDLAVGIAQSSAGSRQVVDKIQVRRQT